MAESMEESCRRWKRGFELAEVVLRAEKLRTLAGMSAAESRRIYDGLCELYYACRASSAVGSPEYPSGAAQVMLRRRFNLLAGR